MNATTADISIDTGSVDRFFVDLIAIGFGKLFVAFNRESVGAPTLDIFRPHSKYKTIDFHCENDNAPDFEHICHLHVKFSSSKIRRVRESPHTRLFQNLSGGSIIPVLIHMIATKIISKVKNP